MFSHDQSRKIIMCVALLLVALVPVAAESKVVVGTVNAGGLVHVLRYPDSRAQQVIRIKPAVQLIVQTYEHLWNPTHGSVPTIPFKLFIDADTDMQQGSGGELSESDFEDLALPNPQTGTIETSKSHVCKISLFTNNALYAVPGLLEFRLAINIAYCYLIHHKANALPPNSDWTNDGLSYWMAVQVYTPPQVILDKIKKDYQDSYNEDVLRSSEEALYFWEFLLGGGVPANLHSPQLPTTLQALEGALHKARGRVVPFTPDLFYAYSQSVAAKMLPWQPDPIELAVTKSLSKLPDDVDLDLEENSIVFTLVNLPKLEPQQGIRIEGNGLGENGVRAALATGVGGFLEIANGQSINVCDIGSSLMVIAGRGPQGGIGSGPSLQFSMIEGESWTESCGQKKKKDPGSKSPSSGLPACVVGTWNAAFPFMDQIWGRPVGVWQYTFATDGSFKEVRALTYKPPPGGTMVMKNILVGTLVVEPDKNTVGRFNIVKEKSKSVVQPGSSVGVGTDPNGFTGDFSGTLKMENLLGIYLTCQKIDDKNPVLIYGRALETPAYNFTLTRTP